jgi:hypothetical protein
LEAPRNLSDRPHIEVVGLHLREEEQDTAGVILGGLLLAFGIVDSPAAAVTMEVGTFSEGNRSTDGLKDIATPERPMN